MVDFGKDGMVGWLVDMSHMVRRVVARMVWVVADHLVWWDVAHRVRLFLAHIVW